MPHSELAHLELLAEVDALVDRLNRWTAEAPTWRPAEKCQALVRRLVERAGWLRVRIEAPLVVATLGGTGTGKSALVNALLGTELVQTSRTRPTTMRPTLLCRPELTPEMLGIDPASVELIHSDLPALRDMVLVDCPDPDTTEEAERGEGTAENDKTLLAGPPTLSALDPRLSSNLARLRAIVPHCDVLLVTATQQKYRSARVIDELIAASRGARLVFVQTHADIEDDIRDDWRTVLKEKGGRGKVEGGRELPSESTDAPSLEATDPIFRVDSLRALADARAGLQPRGEMAELVDLLTRQMAGAAANRIRRLNFLELVAGTLDSCRQWLDEAMPSVRATQTAIDEHRALLAKQLAAEMQSGLLANRRQWENRLLGQVTSRWGLSPFSLVLRAYQGLGGLLAGAMLYRARTPAQLALWGAMEGTQTSRRWQRTRQAERGLDAAAVAGWNAAELRKAAIIIDGYATEAGLLDGGDSRSRAGMATDTAPGSLAAESEAATARFITRVSGELESLVGRLARRHTGWFTRWRYEILLLVMLGLLLYRLAKNFFYDSWFAEHPQTVHGIDFYLSAAFWLVVWCLLLLWAFCSRLRRGLRAAINQLAAGWQDGSSAAGLFAGIEASCRRAELFRQELEIRSQEVAALRRQLATGG
ncbi:MAG: GTPase domain-containing protein [Planctomycetaceae bacterium]|nr:GTPase domain-containing protein [Planctomycetaceae bacterium]